MDAKRREPFGTSGFTKSNRNACAAPPQVRFQVRSFFNGLLVYIIPRVAGGTFYGLDSTAWISTCTKPDGTFNSFREIRATEVEYFFGILV